MTVSLVTAVCGKPGRAFCARGECRCRPVLTSVRLGSDALALAVRDIDAKRLTRGAPNLRGAVRRTLPRMPQKGARLGRKARQESLEMPITPRYARITTAESPHCNADHIGGSVCTARRRI